MQWGICVDHHWSRCVEVWESDGRSEFFAQSVETVREGGEAVLRLVSQNGLGKDIRCEVIGSIRLTPARNINY